MGIEMDRPPSSAIRNLLAGLLLFSLPAAAAVLTVPADANIFAAGQLSTEGFAPGGGGSGSLPPMIDLNTLKEPETIVFGDIGGLVSCCALTPGAYTSPDGGIAPNSLFPSTDVNSVGGISGIQFTGRQMFLVGVFLDDSTPSGGAPPRLTYPDGANAPSYAPALGQVFFIGDGRTSDGQMQIFFTPAGATRLFLGFVDAMGFLGDPGSYGDNVGSTSVEVLNHAPEPGTYLMLGFGLLGIGFLQRFKRA
jgi:PEP-CTERM motif